MPEPPKQSDAFSKKLKCADFLAKVENSLTGPQKNSEPGVYPMTPVAFYSKRNDTCLLVTRFGYGKGKEVRRGFASVDDLLTGQNLETRFFDMRTESRELNEFPEAMMKKYDAP